MLAERDLARQGMAVMMSVCRGLARKLGGKVPVDDLESIGNLALLDVARSWDPGRATFAAYATRRLRWAILDGVRRETHGRTVASRAAALLASDKLTEAQDEAPEPDLPTTQEEDEAALTDLLQAQAAALAVGLLSAPRDVPPIETPEEVVGQAEAAHKV